MPVPFPSNILTKCQTEKLYLGQPGRFMNVSEDIPIKCTSLKIHKYKTEDWKQIFKTMNQVKYLEIGVIEPEEQIDLSGYSSLKSLQVIFSSDVALSMFNMQRKWRLTSSLDKLQIRFKNTPKYTSLRVCV